MDPAVSVVVPFRDRRELLAATLAALDAQTRRDFEVVAVDDGSRDGADRAAAAAVVAGRPVRLLRAGGQGAVAARSLGAATASGEVLAFTDSDCRPDPGWLAAGAGAVEAGADLVNGLTVPARPPRPLERSLASGGEGLFPTANLFVRRSAFEAVGGFRRRSSGPTGFGEDTALGWRLIRMGFTARHEPGAVVRHHVFRPDQAETFRRCWQAGGFPALVAEFPELRSTLVRHRFLLGGTARLPIYAATTAALAGRRRETALALCWWAVARAGSMRGVPLPERARWLPAVMAAEAATAATLVAGSARARTLLL